MNDEIRLGRIRGAILAALGAMGAGCSGDPGGARTEVDLPPQPSASQPIAPPSTPRVASQTGFVKEPDGTIHRASPVTCDTKIDQPACRGDESRPLCKTDADCKDGPNGRCTSGQGQVGTYCACTYACATDADCKADEACVCAAEAGEKHAVCAKARCKTDADCPGFTCGVSRYFDGCGKTWSLACRTAKDECRSDQSCNDKGGLPQCVAAGDHWACRGMGCAIGRPFVVDGAARVAPVEPRLGAWTDADLTRTLAPGAVRLAPEARRLVAAKALEQAALEHASVASFARAALELLALGAPPDLLDDTARAMRDEIAHARIAWAIAAAHGAAAEPGGLDLAGSAPTAVEPARVAYAVAYEGCVGETLGAAECGREAEDAVDHALRSVLARIADDETRHAALAWRTLAWLLAVHGDEVRAAARRGIDDALADMVRGTSDEAARSRAPIVRNVIEPIARRVLEGPLTPRAA